MRGARPARRRAVQVRPNCCTSSAPNDETPTSDTHTGSAVSPWISASLSGHSWIVQWFQSSGKPCTAIASTHASTPCDAMLPTKPGSIGEMPPSTIGSSGASARIAAAAVFTSCAKRTQPGSISKSQCDRLFGSFQIIAASSTPFLQTARQRMEYGAVGRLAHEHFGVGPFGDAEPGAAQHRFGAGGVRDPPVAGVAGVALLDEVQPGPGRVVEGRAIGEGIVGRPGHLRGAAAQHRLEYEAAPHRVLPQQVEGEQRIAQVIEDAHEQHQIEFLAETADVVDRSLVELDVEAEAIGEQPRLTQVERLAVDADDVRRAAPLHLERVEPRVAADLEHRPPGEVRRESMCETAEIRVGIVP